MTIFPLLIFKSPNKHDIKVVLPAPLGPINATQSPATTSKEISCKIDFPLIVLDKFSTVIISLSPIFSSVINLFYEKIAELFSL